MVDKMSASSSAYLYQNVTVYSPRMLTARKVILLRQRDATTSIFSPRGILAMIVPRFISAMTREDGRMICRKLSSTSCRLVSGWFKF